MSIKSRGLSLALVACSVATAMAAKNNPVVKTPGDFGPASYISRDGYKQWGNVYGRPTNSDSKNPCKINEKDHTISFKSLCGRYSFTIECAEALDLMKWAETMLKPVVEEWYGRLADELGSPNYKPYKHVTYRLKEHMHVPGVCSGPRISLHISWIRRNLKNVPLGMVIHETWHSLQHYHAQKPGWMVEALADWVRYFHYQQIGFPEGLKALRVNPKTSRADSKYGHGAAFLEWCRHQYGTRFVHDLIDALRSGEFNDEKWWKKRTGREFSAMAAEWNSGAVTVEVMSYNIRRMGDKGEHSWEARLPWVLNVLDSNRPDVIALQEASYQQLRDIHPHFDGWSASGCGCEKGGKGEMTAILWNKTKLERIDAGKFWLSETPSVEGSKFLQAQHPAVCQWAKFKLKKSGQEFFFFTAKFDRAEGDVRHNSARALMSKVRGIAHDAPVIVAGDFAEAEPSPVLDVFKYKLVNARKAAGEEVEGPAESFNGYGAREPRMSSYIYVSKNFSVNRFETCTDRPEDKYPSCHDPVIARLEFK